MRPKTHSAQEPMMPEETNLILDLTAKLGSNLLQEVASILTRLTIRGGAEWRGLPKAKTGLQQDDQDAAVVCNIVRLTIKDFVFLASETRLHATKWHALLNRRAMESAWIIGDAYLLPLPQSRIQV